MEKVLTISVAAYNAENYIKRVLDSILSEDHYVEKLDIIIVNDGSTDKTERIAKEYVNRYPNIIQLINKKNEGYGSTYNASLGRAKGKYFKILDADDEFISKNIYEFIKCLEKSSADVVLSPYVKVSKKEEIVDCHQVANGMVIKSAKDIVMHEITTRTQILRDFNIAFENGYYVDNELVLYSLLRGKSYEKYGNCIYKYYLGIEGQSVSIESIKKHYDEMMNISLKACKIIEGELNNGIITKDNEWLVIRKLNSIVKNVYTSFLLMGASKSIKNKIKEYDTTLKNHYNFAYKCTNKDKKINLLRKTHFTLFALMCLRERTKRNS